jgi:hypothetical protein
MSIVSNVCNFLFKNLTQLLLIVSSVDSLERCCTGEPKFGVVVFWYALLASLGCIGIMLRSFTSPEVVETSLLPEYLDKKPVPKT